jgi:hypothetical protein
MFTAAEVRAALDELQVWFASKPYGWTERCSEQQLQQYRDREREQEALISQLERLEGRQ